MIAPWQIAGLSEPHHALPLGNGWWRGPAPGSATVESALRACGIECGPALADGAATFRWSQPFESSADADPSTDRVEWIKARLVAACEAWSAPFTPVRFMAVLNLTSDSFSDGGELDEPAELLARAHSLRQSGAHWLDLGAESTRPGAEPVSDDAQLARLLPAIELLGPLGVPLSVDTRSAVVAAACLDAGAALINDVSGLSDPAMGPLLAERGCAAVLMHMRGQPADMAAHAGYTDLLGEVADELAAAAASGIAAGIDPQNLWLDPGIGFAKTAAQSLVLQGRLGALRALGYPLLAGPSRKSFIESVLTGRPAADRDGGTAGAASVCAAEGAAAVRLHRGGVVWDAVRVAAAAGAAAHQSRISENPVAPAVTLDR